MNETYLVSSLRKALEIIDCFTEQDSWSLAELAARLEMSKATIFRILHTFEDAEYLTKDEDTGRYRLGLRLYALGNAAIRNEQLSWQALAPLQQLASETGETVYVGILYNGESVCVQVAEGSQTVRMHSFVGKRSPAHASTLGKVQLAYLPDSEVDEFISIYGLKVYTTNTFTDSTAFKEELHRIRVKGVAIDNEEMELDLTCIGAPISDNAGRVFATIAISAPKTRMSEDRVESLIPRIKQTAMQISRMLGSPTMHRKIA